MAVSKRLRDATPSDLDTTVPSATETTELSSGCSPNSSAADIESIPMVNGQSNKKKTTFAACKFASGTTEETTATVTTIATASADGNRNGDFPSLNTSTPISSYCKTSPPSKPQSVGTTRRRSSLVQPPTSAVAQESIDTSQPAQHHVNGSGSIRRTSVPAKRNSPAFVHQDELWLTQRQCKSKCLLNSDGTSPSDDEADKSIMQRSVSEKSRDKYAHSHHRHHHHRYHHHHQQQSLQQQQQQQQPQHHHHHHHHHPHYQHQHSASVSECHGSTLKKPTPSHVQSTPNVLGTAISDEKLVDLAILPIFQKLLTERRGAAIASCPNIAIKCDIVEYL